MDHVHQSEPLEWVTLQEIAECLQRVTHSKGSGCGECDHPYTVWFAICFHVAKIPQSPVCTHRSSPQLFTGFRVLITKRFDRECSPQLPVSRGFHISILCINIQSILVKSILVLCPLPVLGFLLHMNCGEVWFVSMSKCGLCKKLR